MKIENVPFCTIDWNSVESTRHPGVTGEALWRTFEEGNIRVRMVEYSPGYAFYAVPVSSMHPMKKALPGIGRAFFAF